MRDPERQDLAWWDKDEPHETVVAAAGFIESRDQARKEEILRFMRLYGNVEYSSYDNTTAVRTLPAQDRLTMNLCRSVADTVVARIAKNRPRATFLTEGGNYSLRRKARNLERFVETKFYTKELYKSAPGVVLDAVVLGTGVIKFADQHDDVYYERVFPGELFVDQVEGLYGRPQQIFQRKLVAKDVLKALYPEKANDIDRASAASYGIFGRDTSADQVAVWEAWRLPSGPDSGDGKHVICVDTATLFEEEWEKDHFPFAFLRWAEPLRGFWGVSLLDDIQGLQVEINRLLQKIQKAMHLISVPRVFVDAASKIDKSYINNQIGTIVPYQGSPPIIAPGQAVHPELFNHLWSLWGKGFEIAGVSQLAATSLKPSGLDSGPSLREYNDIQSERFAPFAQRYEEMFMEAARQTVEIGKEIYARKPNYGGIAARDRYSVTPMVWKDVDLEADSYILKVFPTSSLPSTPSGRLAMVQDLLNSQLIDQQTAKKLLDFPDLESDLALDRAAEDAVDHIIERILDNGEYSPPEPFDDLALTLRKMQAAYLKARNENVPADHLELMRQYMAEVMALSQQLQAQQAEAQGMTAADGASPTAQVSNEAQA
jgi:hypothetical protein